MLNPSAVARIRILVGENLVLLMFRRYPDGLDSVNLGRCPLLVSIPSFLTFVPYWGQAPSIDATMSLALPDVAEPETP
jgi:hypothetical protein